MVGEMVDTLAERGWQVACQSGLHSMEALAATKGSGMDSQRRNFSTQVHPTQVIMSHLARPLSSHSHSESAGEAITTSNFSAV